MSTLPEEQEEEKVSQYEEKAAKRGRVRYEAGQSARAVVWSDEQREGMKEIITILSILKKKFEEVLGEGR